MKFILIYYFSVDLRFTFLLLILLQIIIGYIHVMNIFMILDVVIKIMIYVSCSQTRVDNSVKTWIALGWPVVIHLLVKNSVLLKIEGSNHQQSQDGINLE